MKQQIRSWGRRAYGLLALTVCLALASFATDGQDVAFQLDLQHSTVKFTLGDVLHTVHGSFHLKQGSLRLDAASGRLSGEIVVDAKSGDSGSGMREEDESRSPGERPLSRNCLSSRSCRR